MRVVVGVDPGQNGGIAILGIDGELISVIPMPETRRGIVEHLKPYAYGDVVCVVEKVHSMPGQGVSSMFKFGKGCGELLGICTAYGFRILEPTPQSWKKTMLVGTDKSKSASIQCCENLFPGVNLILPRCRKAHDGMAEAILLAEYGRRAEK